MGSIEARRKVSQALSLSFIALAILQFASTPFSDKFDIRGSIRVEASHDLPLGSFSLRLPGKIGRHNITG